METSFQVRTFELNDLSNCRFQLHVSLINISGKLLFGVGTPSRIQKLMEAGVLNPQSVFLDYNYRNKKRQRLIDEKEVKKQLAEFFGAFVETQKQTDTKLFIF